MSDTTPLLVPQVNVNDDSVLLVKWTVPQHALVAAGDVVCEVETSKATAEIQADRGGVLVQTVSPPSRVNVGDPIGVIAATREAALAYVPPAAAPASAVSGTAVPATARAREAAARLGVSLIAVAAAGVQGTIKESDVQRYAGQQGSAAPVVPAASVPPASLLPYLDAAGPVLPFDLAIAANLRRSTDRLILTTVDAECRLDAAHETIRRSLAAGRMLSLLHLTIAAAGRVLPRFPRLMSAVWGGKIYRYRQVDVAFVARTDDGRLFTPVVRTADQLEAGAVAKRCQAEMMRVLRGSVRGDDLAGACFTISQVPGGRATRIEAIPSYGQSAVLGVSPERRALALVEGVVVEQPVVTLTLSYDHALCDGVYAAAFLDELVTELERPPS